MENPSLNLNHYMKKHFQKSPNSILSIGIEKDHQEYYFDLNHSQESIKKTFGLGSISKTIIATYIAHMVHQKKIDLDQTMDVYLDLNPKIKYPKIIDLLTHTSGYHAFIPLMNSLRVLMTKGFNKKNIYTGLDRTWLLQAIHRIKPFKKKKYRYSDFNYAIVALIIETIEERSYQEVVMDFIRHEIKMHNTYYGSHENTFKDRYSWYWKNDNPFLASGGLFSTTEDLIKFLNYQQKHQDVLGISIKKYHQTNLNKKVCTGFSWNAFQKGHYYWHIGGQGYYRSYVLFDVKKHISIVILATVDIDLQHVNKLGSTIYKYTKSHYEELVNELDHAY